MSLSVVGSSRFWRRLGAFPRSSAITVEESTFFRVSRQRSDRPPRPGIVSRIERHAQDSPPIRLTDKRHPSLCARIGLRDMAIPQHFTNLTRRDSVLRHVLLVQVVPQEKVDIRRLAFSRSGPYDVVIHCRTDY